MPFKKYAFILFFFTLLATVVRAQHFEFPDARTLNTPESYKALEPTMLQALNLLESRPVKRGKKKRREAKDYILRWSAGCPYISMDVNLDLYPFIAEYPEYPVLFIGGWARYATADVNNKNSFLGNIAGLQAVIKHYKNNPAIPRSAQLDQVIALDEKGELGQWVQAKLKGK